MPQDEDVLGFSNPWYQHAIGAAADRQLSSGIQIRAATPPSIIATKLAAWKGRGNGDMLASLDLHDILVLIDGRPELPEEISSETPDLLVYITAEFAMLRTDAYFSYLIESALHGYGQLASTRAEHLQEQLDAISASA